MNIKYLNLPAFIFTLILCLACTSGVFAQVEDFERNQQLQYLDLGIQQYESGDYDNADESFRQVLESVKVLPPEICFYFGVNSFYLEKYKQSINWLNKYLALKGTSGQFFEECTKYLQKAEEKYLLGSGAAIKEVEVYEPKNEIDYAVMPQIDCGPSGKVVCPVCKGQTVIIKRTALSYEYKSCPYCDNHGNLSCAEYNLLLEGALKPRNDPDLN